MKMKYCPKCNKQLPDEAVFCSACGCDTGNFYAGANTYGNGYAAGNFYSNASPAPSNDFMAIREFSKKATSIRNFGIVAAILMFGIGFIFSIVIWIKMSSARVPFVTTTDPYELAELESARKKLNLGKTLSFLPLVAIVLSFMIGLLAGL